MALVALSLLANQASFQLQIPPLVISRSGPVQLAFSCL